MDGLAFVEQHLPPRPARVLEIGCGRGELARALADRGFDVVAIDPAAPEGAIYRRVSLGEFADPEPFDAVVAIRSLHHIPDLDGAVSKMAELLRPGGRLIVHEHAWQRLDDRTARWYLERRTAQAPARRQRLRAASRNGTGGARLTCDQSSTGSPAARHARKPPITSVAAETPNDRTVAAARLD